MADNPPAFPHKTMRNTSSDPLATPREFQETGLTMRDYFAGQAIFAGLDWTRYHETGGYAEAAAVAYEIADALLEARMDKGPEHD